MKLPLVVKSHYYRGLLVLSKRDRIVDAEERSLLLQIGELLDFDRRFCEATIDDLLSNVHISRNAIVFPDENIKECFFRDALRVAHADGVLHPAEFRWLQKTARANGWSNPKLEAVIRGFYRDRNAKDYSQSIEMR